MSRRTANTQAPDARSKPIGPPEPHIPLHPSPKENEGMNNFPRFWGGYPQDSARTKSGGDQHISPSPEKEDIWQPVSRPLISGLHDADPGSHLCSPPLLPDWVHGGEGGGTQAKSSYGLVSHNTQSSQQGCPWVQGSEWIWGLSQLCDSSGHSQAPPPACIALISMNVTLSFTGPSPNIEGLGLL